MKSFKYYRFQSLFRDNERSSHKLIFREQARLVGFNPSFGITNVQAPRSFLWASEAGLFQSLFRDNERSSTRTSSEPEGPEWVSIPLSG